MIALYDVVPERASETAAAYDVPHVAPTLEDLLDRREIEAVIVATPPVAHREHTTMALAAGKARSMREAVRSKCLRGSGNVGDRRGAGALPSRLLRPRAFRNWACHRPSINRVRRTRRCLSRKIQWLSPSRTPHQRQSQTPAPGSSTSPRPAAAR